MTIDLRGINEENGRWKIQSTLPRGNGESAHHAGATREPVLITKRGQPIAKLVPADEPAEFLGRLAGIVKIHGDIESPIESPESWEVLR